MSNTPKRLPYDEFIAIYNKVPRLCIDLVIQKGNTIILSKRDIPPSLGMLHLPGGTLLMGETIKEAAERVAKEETNLEIEIIKTLGVVEYFQEHAIGQSIGLVLLVKPVSGELQGSKQAKEIQYFDHIPENTIEEQKKFLIEQKLLS